MLSRRPNPGRANLAAQNETSLIDEPPGLHHNGGLGHERRRRPQKQHADVPKRGKVASVCGKVAMSSTAMRFG